MLTQRLEHLPRGFDVHQLHRAGRRQLGARDQHHVGAAVPGGLGDRVAHLAGRAVAEEAHRVGGLTRAAGGHGDAHAREVTALAPHPRLDVVDDLRGLHEPARTDLARGDAPLHRTEQRDAALGQQHDVVLRRRVRPHLRVHGRGYQRGAAHRERGQRDEVVGEALREPGERGGGGGHHEVEVGAAPQGDVRLGVRAIGRPELDEGLAAGDRAERERADELGRRLRHHDLHGRAGLDQPARDLDGLVGRDRAAHAEDDRAAGERRRRGDRLGAHRFPS